MRHVRLKWCVRARTHTHASIHTDIFQKPCILILNTLENNYNMFLQQLKKLLSHNFLEEEAKKSFTKESKRNPRTTLYAHTYAVTKSKVKKKTAHSPRYRGM